MSYDVLRGLYYGESTNADLTDLRVRSRLHVPSPLDQLVPTVASQGLDLVLTGNPGDGKSHLIATLQDRGSLDGCDVVLDLSARPSASVLDTWTAAVNAKRSFILCANEGPLRDFLTLAGEHPLVRTRARELSAQLGRLTLTNADTFPPRPEEAWLIDLADRNVLGSDTIEQALKKVCNSEFLPSVGLRTTDSSVGRNLLLFGESVECRARFARLVGHAGRRLDEHVTFRQLWACISYALTSGKSENTVRHDLNTGHVGLGTYPVDHLVKVQAKGALIKAIRTFADPVDVSIPDLDDDIWFRGEPRHGDWLCESPSAEPPERLWARGERESALANFESLKRLVALAHEEGDGLLKRLEENVDSPETLDDEGLRTVVMVGIRRCFLSAEHEPYAPPWLRIGIPLWIGHTYQDVSPAERPYVAVETLSEDGFAILRPTRAPWLGHALGRALPVAWFVHERSGIRLRLDASFIGRLHQATLTSGPLAPPDRVLRFLAMLAGWQEEHGGMHLGRDHFGVLGRPRGALTTSANVIDLESGGSAYGAAEETRR